MKYNNYFDLIRIFTVIPERDLQRLIDVPELKQYAGNVEIGEAHGLVQIHGYRGRIELFQATDKAIEILQRYYLSEHCISRIEIARDMVCNNSLVAEKYRETFQNNRYLKWGKGGFSIGNTKYLGKEEGKSRGLYASCYNPVKPKLGCVQVVHVEFVLSQMRNIRKKLGIDTIYDLGRAEDYFTLLFDKFLVKAKINQSRLKKHFPDKELQNVGEMVEFITNYKEGLRDRKQRHETLNILCDKMLRKKFGLKKKFTFTKKEELILNQGVSYWLKQG